MKRLREVTIIDCSPTQFDLSHTLRNILPHSSGVDVTYKQHSLSMTNCIPRQTTCVEVGLFGDADLAFLV